MKTIKLVIVLIALIYSSTIYSQEADEQNALLIVSVKGKSGDNKAGEKVAFKSYKTKTIYKGETKADGTFKVLLPKGEKYAIQMKSFEKEVKLNDIEIPNQPGLIQFEYEIIYELPKTYVLESVFFDSGKASLKPASYKALNSLAELLNIKKTLIIEIGGHTDNVGNKDANMTLSKNRAESVKRYLLKKGVSVKQVKTKGYGDTMPVAYNNTADGRQKNRRTQVTVLQE